MRSRTALALSAILLTLATSASAQEPPVEPIPPIDEYIPTFTRTDAWLHANSSLIGNLDAREGRFLQWNGTVPTASTAAMYNGNNYAFIFAPLHDPLHFLTMQGTASGDLDAIAFDLYLTGWAQAIEFCPVDLSLELVLDGVSILEQDVTGSTGYTYQKVDDTTVKMRFALTNLWEATKTYLLPYGPDVQHNIYLNIQTFYACNEVTWLYDAADTPAGLTVNLPTPGQSGYFEVDVLNPPPPLAP